MKQKRKKKNKVEKIQASKKTNSKIVYIPPVKQQRKKKRKKKILPSEKITSTLVYIPPAKKFNVKDSFLVRAFAGEKRERVLTNIYNEIISSELNSNDFDNEEIIERVLRDLFIPATIEEILNSKKTPSIQRHAIKTLDNKKNYVSIIGKITLDLLRNSEKNYKSDFENKYSVSHYVINDLAQFLQEKFNINITFKEKKTYSFNNIVDIVKEVGRRRYRREGILIRPKDEKEFKDMTINIAPYEIDLLVSCGVKGHKNWVTTLRDLSADKWCRKCYFESRSIKFSDIQLKIKEIGKKKYGKEGILKRPKNEEEYKELKEKLNVSPSLLPLIVWCGNEDHKPFKTKYNRLQNEENWCSKCYHESMSLSFSEIRQFIELAGLNNIGIKATLISPEDEDQFKKLFKSSKRRPSKAPLLISCNIKGHRNWTSTYNEIRKGSWCEVCSQGKYEQRARWYFEKVLSFILGYTINAPKIHLNGLSLFYNEDNYTEDELASIQNLLFRGHFDAYIKLSFNGNLLKIAFEYNGKQHYEFPNAKHNTIEEFEHQRLLDKIKKKICLDNDIILIVFKYDKDERMRNPKKIQNFIIEELKKKTRIPFSKFKIPYFDHRNPEFGQYRMDEFL